MYESFLSDLLVALPTFLVAGMGILVVLLDAFRNDDASIPWLAGVALVAAAVMEALRVGAVPQEAFLGHVVTGGIASFVNLVILIGAFGGLALAFPYFRRSGHNFGEVYALVLFATSGMMALASAGSLIVLFVGLETMSICLYVLTGLVRERERANESALKYFLLGAFATGFFLYGIALMYGATGAMLFSEMGPGLEGTGREGLFVAGVALLLIGFFFKVGAVPFHMWTPDVYQGAPTPLTAYMSTASKTAAFGALIVVLLRVIPVESMGGIQWALGVVAVVTMVVGNVLAISQANVKRMLAYSSIAHAGYVLVGLAAGTTAGYSAALFYLLAYTLMNLGAFGVLAVLEWDGEQGAVQDLDSLSGIGFERPVLGVSMGVFMFALTGFPPLAGFIGKYFVFAAAIQQGLVWLAIVGVLASVVSAFYYLRVLVVFWMKDTGEQPEAVRRFAFPSSRMTTAVVLACVVGLLLFGIVPGLVTSGFEGIFEVPAGVVAISP